MGVGGKSYGPVRKTKVPMAPKLRPMGGQPVYQDFGPKFWYELGVQVGPTDA